MKEITKEQFIKLIEDIQKVDDITNKLYRLGIDILDHPIKEIAIDNFLFILRQNYDEEDVDIITWWLWEVDKEDYHDCLWDADGTPIPIKTVDDVWNYLQSNKE